MQSIFVLQHCDPTLLQTVFSDPLPSEDKFKTWTVNSSNWWSFWRSKSIGIMEIKRCAVLVHNYCSYHYSPAFHLWLLHQWHWVTSARSPGKVSASRDFCTLAVPPCWATYVNEVRCVWVGKMQGMKKLPGTWPPRREGRKSPLLPSLGNPLLQPASLILPQVKGNVSPALRRIAIGALWGAVSMN